MTTLYAQPYDISAQGFYFESAAAYTKQASKLKNDYGQPVEEFEIQFIDGESLDAELFEALKINQCNFGKFFEIIEEWTDHDKYKTIVAVREAGYSFDIGKDGPDRFDVEFYPFSTLRELAEHFVDEGLFGDIPDNIRHYLDYDAIGRDLSMDYGQTIIDGTAYVYRCD